MIDLLIALIIDFLIGDPYSFPHPVKLMGRLIALEERTVRKITANKFQLKVWGGIIVVINLTVAFFIPLCILKLLKCHNLLFHIVNIYLLYTCVAAKCLQKESMKIYEALSKSIDEARYKLSFIVGRDTKNLNENEVIRATVETVAENTSDGVIAPIIFAIIGGAPLALLYKMVNTMDSMLGYLNEKYKDIGFFSAKTDDVFNFIPARLTGIFMCIGSIFRFNIGDGLKIMIRDRKNHKSPNCAYPEGAVAGLLAVQLGGDNVYFGEVMKKPKIGDKKRELQKEDIKNTIEIMYRAEIAVAILIGIWSVLR